MILRKILLLVLIPGFVFAQRSGQTKYNFNDFSLIVNVEDQEARYNEMVKESPIDPEKPSTYQEYRAQLAVGFIAKGNFEKYWQYKNTQPAFNALQFVYLTYALEKLLNEGKNDNELVKVTNNLVDEFQKGTLKDPMGRMHTIFEVDAVANARTGKVGAAVDFFEKEIAKGKLETREMAYFPDAKSNYLHRLAEVMFRAGKAQVAFDTLTTAFRTAESNPYMVATFKEVYKKVKGSEKGFDKYLNGLKAEAYQKYYKEVEKLYIADAQQTLEGTFSGPGTGNKPMTLFRASKPVKDITLLDLSGKNVNLGQHQGKVLVIDFWTTLCTPCVAAFAGFEKVVADYKKEEFQLYVIDLFEDEKTVQSFAAKKQIPLEILRDEENAAYNVQGTPTKIVFDPMGNIRFYGAGYAGSTDREYYKLKAMVEIIRSRNSSISKKG